MPQGLEVYDENGNVIYSTANRIGKFLGTIAGGTVDSPVTGSFTVPANLIPTDSTLFFITTGVVSTVNGTTYNDITISGRVINYQRLYGTLYYGVY